MGTYSNIEAKAMVSTSIFENYWIKSVDSRVSSILDWTSKSIIGVAALMNPTFTNLSNLALTVGVDIQVSRLICRNDLRPSLNSDFKIDNT